LDALADRALDVLASVPTPVLVVAIVIVFVVFIWAFSKVLEKE